MDSLFYCTINNRVYCPIERGTGFSGIQLQKGQNLVWQKSDEFRTNLPAPSYICSLQNN